MCSVKEKEEVSVTPRHLRVETRLIPQMGGGREELGSLDVGRRKISSYDLDLFRERLLQADQ